MFRRLIHKFNEYRFNKRMARQRYKRGFADDDCWGMNYWLVSTFPDMILHLRDMKHGAPELPFEEFDALPLEWKDQELQKYKYRQEQDGYEYEPDSIFTKWYILLTRMAYCLKEADADKEMYNPYKKEYDLAVWGPDFGKEKFFTDFWNKHCEKVDGGYIIKNNEPDPEFRDKFFKCEEDNCRYKEQMKDEAMDLLKKYFYNLWD